MPNPKEPILVLQDVIQTGMGLNNGQVMLAYQKWDIPTSGLFIVLNYVGPARTIGAMDDCVPTTEGMTEIQSVTKHYLISVDVMSFDSEARLNKELVEMTLNSVYSEQQQEANAMQIGRVNSGWMDVSQLEPTQYLNCFTMTVQVTAVYQRTNPDVPYYTDFTRALPPPPSTNEVVPVTNS